MTFLTLELRVLTWLVLAWLALMLVALAHGAPVAAVAFGVWRRIRRRRSRWVHGPQAVGA